MSGDPYRQAAEQAREIDADVELFRHSLARTRTRTIFAVTYAAAAILVLGAAALLGVGAFLVAIVVLALVPKLVFSVKGRRL